MKVVKLMITSAATVAMAGAIGMAYGQSYSPRHPVAASPSGGNNETSGSPLIDDSMGMSGGRVYKSTTLSSGYPRVPSAARNETSGSPTLEDMTLGSPGTRTGNNHMPNPRVPSAGRNETTGSPRIDGN